MSNSTKEHHDAIQSDIADFQRSKANSAIDFMVFNESKGGSVAIEVIMKRLGKFKLSRDKVLAQISTSLFRIEGDTIYRA